MSAARPTSTPVRARIPADIDRDDRLLAGLTARQLGILTIAGLAGWGLWQAADVTLPTAVAAGVAAPVLLAGVALALGRRDGLSLDRLAAAALRYQAAPRRLVAAPDGVTAPPAWAGAWAGRQPLPPAPLTGPVRDLTGDGLVDLGADGSALQSRASTVQFRLRTPDEQQALLAGFARVLHAIDAPVQILARAQRVDLAAQVAELTTAAPGLPHPALEAAARAYARYLDELAGRREVLRRELLVVFRAPEPPPVAGRLLTHRAAQAAALLAGVGVTLTVLDTAAAARALAAAADPDADPIPAGLAAPGAVITSPTPPPQEQAMKVDADDGP